MRAKLPGIAMVAAVLCAPVLLRADLQQAKAETNLEKRSKLALDNADSALKRAREAYRSGDIDKAREAAGEALESVELCRVSLVATGKDPRRNPKWFKRAELQTRDLLRRIEAAQQEMSYVDRPMLDSLRAKTQQVHDELLTGLMEGNKRK